MVVKLIFVCRQLTNNNNNNKCLPFGLHLNKMLFVCVCVLFFLILSCDFHCSAHKTFKRFQREYNKI